MTTSRRAVGNTLAEDPATVVSTAGPALTDLAAAVRHVIGTRADGARTAPAQPRHPDPRPAPR